MRYATCIIATLALPLALAACGQPDVDNAASLPTLAPAVPMPVPSEQATPEAVAAATSGAPTITPWHPPVVFVDQFAMHESFEESVASAEIIVIGEIIGLGETFNSQRDVADNTKPATDGFGVGQEYFFEVQRYLKGSGSTTLTVVQTEGGVRARPATVTEADIARARAASSVPPLVKGTRYLLLLRSIARYYPGKDYYTGQAEPWRFELSSDGRATMISPAGLGVDFAPDQVAELVGQVEQVVRAQQQK
jgi:hypothetical protein